MIKKAYKSRLKLFLLLFLGSIVGIFFYFDMQQYVSLEQLKEHRGYLSDVYNQDPILSILGFVGLYILVTTLSLPGATILTIASGSMFGLYAGLMISSFASVIGAALAFLVARVILRDFFQNRYSEKLKTINEGFEKEGAFYLFALRLVPVFPFFLVNLVMGLTPIRLVTYIVVSFVGMLPGTAIYVFAGVGLSTFDGNIQLELLFALAVLGLFPLLAKRTLNYVRRKYVT